MSSYIMAGDSIQRLDLGEHQVDVYLSGEQTGGRMGVFAFDHGPIRVEDGGGHRHLDADKVVYIVAGTYHWTVNDEVFDAGAGEVVFVPKDAYHEFTTDGGRAFFVMSPAGMEGFFVDFADAMAKGEVDEAAVADLERRYHVDGRPLSPSS